MAKLWTKPTLRLDEENSEHRKVGWIELFYDLVFVVVIANITHHLSEHLSAHGLLVYIFLFAATWWVWVINTYYIERFETEDLSYRIGMFLKMAGVAAMAAYAPDVYAGEPTHFAIAYFISRFITSTYYLRASVYEPSYRPIGLKFAISGYFFSSVFLISSLWAPEHFVILSSFALMMDLLVPATVGKAQINLPRLSSSKLPERFGLITIILLGESVVSSIRSMSASSTFLLPALLSLSCSFLMWWVYFDFVARRPHKVGGRYGITWAYLHFLLSLSIVLAGGVTYSLVTGTDHVSLAIKIYLSTISLFLVSVGALELTLKRESSEPTHKIYSPLIKFCASLIPISLSLLNSFTGAHSVLLISNLILLIVVTYGVYVWSRNN